MKKVIKGDAFNKQQSDFSKAVEPLRTAASSIIPLQFVIGAEKFTKLIGVMHHEAMLREDIAMMAECGRMSDDEVMAFADKYWDVNCEDKAFRIAKAIGVTELDGHTLTLEDFKGYDPRSFTFGINYFHRTDEMVQMWLAHIRELVKVNNA